jgi:hypothetical protein
MRTGVCGNKEETCPVLEKAELECYCPNMTSLNIPKAVEFCLGDFRQCPIYNNYMGKTES